MLTRTLRSLAPISRSLTLSLPLWVNAASPLQTAARPCNALLSSGIGNWPAIMIKGLSFRATEHDIRNTFEGVNIEKVIIEAGRDGRPSGRAFLVLGSADDVSKAMQYDRAYIGARYIELQKTDVEAAASAREATQSFPGEEPGRFNASMGPPYALKLEGMPFSADSSDITAFLDGVNLSKVIVEGDPAGRKSGNGYVLVNSADDAQKVLAMNRKYLGPRFVLISQVPATTLNSVRVYDDE